MLRQFIEGNPSIFSDAVRRVDVDAVLKGLLELGDVGNIANKIRSSIWE